MTEEYRRGVILRKLGRMEIRPAGPAMPTGFRVLDAILGTGGLPRGRIMEWFGPPACGKSTLALQVAAHLQQAGSVAAWMDADRTFDPRYAAALGVRLERLPVAQPDTAEAALEVGRQLVASGAVDLLVVDSAAALTPGLELESGLGDAVAGLQTRVLATGLRRLSATARRAGGVVLLLNQTRSRPGEAGEGETSAGGPALKLFAPVRLALQPDNGCRLRLRILKNTVSEAFRGGVLDRRESAGFADPL